MALPVILAYAEAERNSIRGVGDAAAGVGDNQISNGHNDKQGSEAKLKNSHK